MIVAMPLAKPVTMPVPGSTVAIDVLLLLHVPGPDASVNATVAPGQIGVLPVIDEGNEITLTVVVAIQPVGATKVIVVVPKDTDATDPDGLTVATEVLLLLQDIPPGVGSDRKVVAPTHTVVFPSIAPGKAFMLIVRVT